MSFFSAYKYGNQSQGGWEESDEWNRNGGNGFVTMIVWCHLATSIILLGCSSTIDHLPSADACLYVKTDSTRQFSTSCARGIYPCGFCTNHLKVNDVTTKARINPKISRTSTPFLLVPSNPSNPAVALVSFPFMPKTPALVLVGVFNCRGPKPSILTDPNPLPGLPRMMQYCYP